MAIISFTPADALLTTLCEVGNYNATLTGIEGPKASQSQKSLSFYVTFCIKDGPLAGKEVTVCLNSAVKNVSVLGGTQFLPQAAFLQIEAAMTGKKVEPIARPDFDTDSLVGKDLTLQIGVSTDEGKMVNVINNFLPFGTAAGVVPF